MMNNSAEQTLLMTVPDQPLKRSNLEISCKLVKYATFEIMQLHKDIDKSLPFRLVSTGTLAGGALTIGERSISRSSVTKRSRPNEPA